MAIRDSFSHSSHGPFSPSTFLALLLARPEGCLPSPSPHSPASRQWLLCPNPDSRSEPPTCCVVEKAAGEAARLPRKPGAELCSQSRSLRGQQVLLLLASICPKSHRPTRRSAPCCVWPALRRPPREGCPRAQSCARLFGGRCPSRAPPPQAPAQPVFSVHSCCQVRKHCEWCQALVCRHEKPSALLKGRTACCHSETGKGPRRGGTPFPCETQLGGETSAFSRAGQMFLEGEAGRGCLPSQVRFSLS